MKVLNPLDMTSQRITSLGSPSGGTDAATKDYVDNVARGLSYKAPVRASPTGNVSLASPGATFDGVALAVNDRVLLQNQTAQAENGIWVWIGASVPMTRSADADTGGELTPGTAVTVTAGAVYGDKTYMIISDTAITIGTTAMVWGQLGGGTIYTASNGVQLTGSNFSGVAAPGGGLTVGGTGFAVDASVIARKLSGTMGNGSLTTIDVTHSLGTKDVIASVREVVGDAKVLVDWVALDNNTVRFSFAVAPAASSLRWTVIG
jgi:hypothetical protein